MAYSNRYENGGLNYWRTQYDLDEFDTGEEHIVETLLYAASLSLLVSRDLLALVTEQADDEIVFLPERWRRQSGRTPGSFRTNSVNSSATLHYCCRNG